MTVMSFAAFIFDYGNVLSLPQDIAIVATMADRLGVTLDAFRDAYHQPRAAYDVAAISAHEYWQQVATILGRPTVTASVVEELIARDIESWTQYREEVWDLARRLHDRGFRTAILSNCPHQILARIRLDRPMKPCFDVTVFSCEVGFSKPNPQIYAECIRRLGVTPGEVLFVDDHPANITMAMQLGWRAYQFAGENPLGNLRLLIDSA